MEWECWAWGDIWWSERTELDGAEANEELPHSDPNNHTSLQVERERRREARVRRRRVNHGASILETQQIYKHKLRHRPPALPRPFHNNKRRLQGKANKTRQRAGGK